MQEKIVLGDQKEEILKTIDLKENIIIRGIPGIGLTTLSRNISNKYKKRAIVINPHESTQEPNSLILNKLNISNNLITHLNTIDKPLIIILNKFNDFKSPSKWQTYLQEIRKTSFYKVVLVFTVQIKKADSTHINIPCKEVVFSGFNDDYKTLFTNICNYYSVKSTDFNIKNCYLYTLGHAGLTKSLIYNAISNASNNYNSFIKYSDTQTRLNNIYKTLLWLKLVTPNGFKVEKKQECFNYGVLGKSGYMKFLSLYIESIKDKTLSNISTSSMTVTELKILKILQSTKEFQDVNKILSNFSKEDQQKLTDWTIYKHINNLNKKIKKQGFVIKNKRGIGYKLV